MNRICATLLFALAFTGCVFGVRQAGPPSSAAGYQQVELRDIAPRGLENVNVEVIGNLGALSASDECGGMITIPLMSAATDDHGAMVVVSAPVELTLPRERCDEVRDFPVATRVRVRGYLSAWMGSGCTLHFTDGSRFLWVDTVERALPEARQPAPGSPTRL